MPPPPPSYYISAGLPHNIGQSSRPAHHGEEQGESRPERGTGLDEPVQGVGRPVHGLVVPSEGLMMPADGMDQWTQDQGEMGELGIGSVGAVLLEER